MTHIAFFGHDSTDSAVRRRVQSFRDDGLTVKGFMMKRREDVDVPWDNVDLGTTRDRAFFQRIKAIFTGARRAADDEAGLSDADIIYARNLDMLATAFLAKRYARLDTPVIYESLDVHALLVRRDPIGAALRFLERTLLKRCRALVVSSPGFLRNYFEKYHKGLYTAHLVENRMAAGAAYGVRRRPVGIDAARPLVIGWVGMLRCQRSLDLLLAIADRFGDRVRIHMHGIPARSEIDVFEPEIDKRDNVHFYGRYNAPEDLSEIYAGIDVVWAGDFMDAGANSVWLLPNRIYEGGYYNTPAIAPQGTETARWLEQHNAGFAVPEPLETELPDFIQGLLEHPCQITQNAKVLSGVKDDVFIQPQGFLADILGATVAVETASP